MRSCAFFGHRDYDYREQEEMIRGIIIELIERYSVTQFYAGGRGKFDHTCARIVHNLKEKYPHITLTKVLSYIPTEKEKYTGTNYDGSVYLLERYVPKKYAIIETNKALVDKVDFIISGVDHDWGGAAKAVEYAYAKKKAVLEVFVQTNKERWWLEFSNVGSMPLPDDVVESLATCAQRAIERIEEEKRQAERKKRKKMDFHKRFFKNPASKA